MFALALAATLAAAAEPVWTLDLEASPWPFLADAGVLLLATDAEILGVDAADGSIRWRRSQPESVVGDLFQRVPFTDHVLLSTLAVGPDTFEVVDARTGTTSWTAPAGDVVLGVWPTPDALRALVMTDRVDDPGHFALAMVDLARGEPVWRVEDAAHAAPPLGPTRSGRTAAVTARRAPLPRFVGDQTLTAWSPHDGFALRRADGTVAWRVVVPGVGRTPTVLDRPADPVVGDGVAWVAPHLDQVVPLDLDTGAPLWRASRGKARGAAARVLLAGDLVVLAGGAWVVAFDAADGRRAWRVPAGAWIDGAVVADGTVIVDAGTTLRGFGLDGVERFATALDDLVAVDLDVVGDLVIARHDLGVTALRPDGSIVWRRGGEGTRPEASPWGGSGPAASLFRETPPPDHPAATEHVWVAVERVDGRQVAVLHRVDLLTGEESTVALGGQSPRWMWDPRTGTAIVVGRAGRIEAFRPAP